MDIKHLPAVGPTGPTRAASSSPHPLPLQGRDLSLSKGARGENPLCVAMKVTGRRLDLAALSRWNRMDVGSTITATLFQSQGGKQLLEV